MEIPETSRPKIAPTNGENITKAEGDTVRCIRRELLFLVWGEQACQRREHWPEVRQRLQEKLAARIDDAIAELARVGDVPSADDPLAVWRAFPLLDRDHCAKLAKLINEAHAALQRQEAVDARDDRGRLP